MDYYQIFATHTDERIARFENNQKLKAIEYLKQLNSKNDYAIELFYKQKKEVSFNKFLEEFSLRPEFQIMRDYSIIKIIPNHTFLKNDKVETRPKISLV
jgi:hypothetical protein